jgi:DNA-binding response OmpR family regulator
MRSVRVLVADDHTMVAGLLRKSFEDVGYDVVVEQRADRVKEVAIGEQVGLAVVDVNMSPGQPFDGLRSLIELGAARPAIIVVSGDHSPAIRQRALELGADAFLLKPWEPDELVELADSVLADR